MKQVLAHSLIFIFCISSISILQIGSFVEAAAVPDVDPCAGVNVNQTKGKDELTWCKTCVKTSFNATATNGTCEFIIDNTGENCKKPTASSEFTKEISVNEAQCEQNFPTSNTTTTTVAPPSTTNGTSTTPAPSNGTTTATTTTTTTPASTTTVPTVPTTTTGGTTTTTTSGTTAKTTVKPEPAPSGGGGFSFATFLGGIVFTLAIASLGYIIWRFYKARTEQNYHTLKYGNGYYY